jgi:hypothetical protein
LFIAPFSQELEPPQIPGRFRQLKYYLFCKNAGRAEHFAHALLNEHKEYRNYIFEGNYKDCTEIFNCSVKDAVEAVKAAYRQSN